MKNVYADIKENFKITEEERLYKFLVRYLKLNELKADEIEILMDFIEFYIKHS